MTALWSALCAWWKTANEKRQQRRSDRLCGVCGCERTWEDGCGCYYRAIGKAAEQKDIIGRLTQWQQEERALDEAWPESLRRARERYGLPPIPIPWGAD